MTVSQTRRAFAWPARHFASDADDPALPRMGERLRLRASVDVSGLPRQARVIARALKRYGLIGQAMYALGAKTEQISSLLPANLCTSCR